jgi:hypothetical protein
MIAMNYRFISQLYVALVALFLLVMPSTLSSSVDRFNNLHKNGAFHPQNVDPIGTAQLFRITKQISQHMMQGLKQKQQHSRNLLWETDPSGWDFGEGFDPYQEYELMYAPSYGNYSKWYQAYRMLGVYIDCDHPSQNADEANENDNNYYSDGAGEVVQGCARWMMWAAYVVDDSSSSSNQQQGSRRRRLASANESLTCGEKGSPWKVIGVYRQEFFQFLEQIAKHKFAITDARYITMLAGLDYMTKYDCQYVGVDNRGNKLYAGVQPLSGAYFQMSLYSDSDCLKLSNSKYTYDDFFAGSNLNLNCDSDDWTTCTTTNSNNNNNNNNKNGKDRALRNDDYSVNYDYHNYNNLNFNIQSQYQASQVWKAAQEYTLTNLNQVLQEFTMCTPCMDYPTYQDGVLNGYTGYSDDDLINQCWKFYSHNSYSCNGDCQTMARRQGTVYNASPNSTFYDRASKREKYYVKRAVSVVDDEDFRCSAFFVTSTVLFVTAIASFLLATRGKVYDYFCNDMADDEPCVAGCGTSDLDPLPEDNVTGKKKSPWYKSIASRSLDDTLPPPPPPPPPRKAKATTTTTTADNQSLYITPSKTKSMDDDSPSKDALLPSSPSDLDHGYSLQSAQSQDSRYNPPRYMYSMDE